MRRVKITAVVLAILGGTFALLGYTAVVRDGGVSDAYGWFFFISVVIIVAGGVAVLSRPQGGSISGAAPRHRVGEQVEEQRVDDDNEPNLGMALFWLGIVVLDVLFVLFALWLFAPSLALSQKIYSSMGGVLAIVMLDIGITSILVGYSRAAPAIRV